MLAELKENSIKKIITIQGNNDMNIGKAAWWEGKSILESKGLGFNFKFYYLVPV